MQPLKDRQYSKNRQIIAEAAHIKKLNTLNVVISDNQGKLKKPQTDQAENMRALKEEYDKYVAAHSETFGIAIETLKKGAQQAQQDIGPSTAEHLVACAEIRNTIEITNNRGRQQRQASQTANVETTLNAMRAENLKKKGESVIQVRASEIVEVGNTLVGITLSSDQLQCTLDMHMKAALELHAGQSVQEMPETIKSTMSKARSRMRRALRWARR